MKGHACSGRDEHLLQLQCTLSMNIDSFLQIEMTMDGWDWVVIRVSCMCFMNIIIQCEMGFENQIK